LQHCICGNRLLGRCPGLNTNVRFGVISRHLQCNSQQRPQKRTSANHHVCFTSESRHVRCSSSCRLWAKQTFACRKKSRHRYQFSWELLHTFRLGDPNAGLRDVKTRPISHRSRTRADSDDYASQNDYNGDNQTDSSDVSHANAPR
jgi:hypothetical protein